MNKNLAIEIPSVPNYIRIASMPKSDAGLGIEYFTDEELEKIGNEWTQKLIEHAHRRAAAPPRT